MVKKNASGGKRARAASRKGAAPQLNTRLATDGEMYAVVTKFWGNGMVEVKCADGTQRKCVIRKSFRGSHKRDNLVAVNGAVLVAARDYESSDAKCDLLEVYSSADVERINDSSLNTLMPDHEKEDTTFLEPALTAVVENDSAPISFDDI